MKGLFLRILITCLSLIFVSPPSIFSQAACAAGNYAEPYYYGPYEEVGGNFYIRVYVYFIGTTEWTQSSAEIRMRGILENLNNVFNEHGIFFVPFDFEEDECSYSYPSIFLITNTGGQEKENALTIEQSSDAGGINGYVTSIPGHYVFIQGTQDDGPTSLHSTLIHEVGHALGLAHTHEGNVSGLGPVCNELNSGCSGGVPDACNCCGDFVCETPYNSIDEIDLNNSCIDVTTSSPEIIARNYMSYVDDSHNSCRNIFATEQIRRIRYCLKNHVELQDMQVFPTILPGGTLSTFSSDIIIESGVQEINDPLFMLPGARITVKKGARLKIYSTITAACDGMWEGIVVEGTTSFSQSKSGTNYDQGWVSLYGDGVIEHAKVGIRLEAADANGDSVPLTGSGILYPCIGSFTNCTTSIKFGPQFSPTSNVALIMNADFLLDSEYRGGSSPQPIFIDMLFNTMVNIRGCSFLDSRSVCNDEKAIGIDAKASSVSTWSNDYEDLAVGLRLNQQFFGATVVNNSTYTNCYLSIETIKSSKFSIYNNDFLLGTPTGCTAAESVGVTLSGNTAGLTFRKNSFSQNGSGTTIGTEVKSTMLGMNNIIFDNDYTDLDIGNIAYGDNGSDQSGLSYACNTHSGDEDDYIVEGDATIWSQQKYVDPTSGEQSATGNLFSGGSGKGSFNNAGSGIQYFYSGSANAMNQEHFSYNSATYSGVTGVPETSNGDCADVPPCNPCHPSSIYSGLWKANFYDKRQERNDKLITLGSLTKPADIAAMQDSISNLKQVMDRNASLVLQSYAQDTTEAATLQLDSIFAWLARSENYAADLELANMYFFMNKLDKFDTLWAGISTAHNLSGDDLDEFDELGLVYDLLRPTMEEEENLAQLDESVIDSLAFWQGWCSEPGYLTKSVLLWNGIATTQDCDHPQKTTERAGFLVKKKNSGGGNSPINVYPNPTNNILNIEFQQEASSTTLSFFDVQGKLRKLVHMNISGGHPQLSIEELPSGLYILRVQTDLDKPYFAKLEVLH